MVGGYVIKNLVEMLAVSIGNENLAESVVGNYFDDRFDALCIEFVEYVIE